MKYYLRIFTCLFFLTIFLKSHCQTLFYSDCIKGGVSVAGVATGGGGDIYKFPIFKTNSANIKKVLLVSFATIGKTQKTSDITFELNSTPIELNPRDNITFYVGNNLDILSHNPYWGHRTHIIDITETVNLDNDSIFINWEFPLFLPESCFGCRYGAPIVVILYEDETMNNTCFNLIINNQTNDNEIVLKFPELPPANFQKDIGIAVHSDRLGGQPFGNPFDGYDVLFNNLYIGRLNGQDTNLIDGVIGDGVIGNFYYQNGVLTGYTDDVANDSFNGSDGLLLANSYLNNLSDIEMKFKYIQPATYPHNYLISLMVTYESNCEIFETQTSQDTVICLGESAPLFASGGQAYKWEPQIGLSCYDCPNPIFNHDSTITYTVRIWNNDSCSKVLPVRVRVHKPQAPQISTTPSLCADSTGSVKFSGLSEFNAPFTYQLLGMSNASGSFANVPPGEHNYSITNKYGCVYEGTATVGVIPPKAQFTANPEQGQEPLSVTFNNSSQNANGYTWIIGTDTFYTQSHTHTFDTAGQYQVLLIAYNNNPECADTAMFTVNVFAQFFVLIPNVFTPNGDGVNDDFTFEASRIREAEWEIFNRWGNTLHKGDWSTEQAFFNDTHIIPVWNGITQRNEPPPDGVYFYKITVKTLNNVFETFTGNVTLVR